MTHVVTTAGEPACQTKLPGQRFKPFTADDVDCPTCRRLIDDPDARLALTRRLAPEAQDTKETIRAEREFGTYGGDDGVTCRAFVHIDVVAGTVDAYITPPVTTVKVHEVEDAIARMRRAATWALQQTDDMLRRYGTALRRDP